MSKNNDKVSFWKLLNEKKIIIPIIQRDYAQGREGKEFLRERSRMEKDMAYPGGECAGDVVLRAHSVMKEIISRDYENVAVVTHGGVIRSLVAYYLGMDLAKVQLLGAHLENTGITELWVRKSDGRVSVNRFNDAGHLEDHPELLRRGWRGKR